MLPAFKVSAKQPRAGPPRGLRMEKEEDTGPEQFRCAERSDVSEPRLLRLPIHRKALKLLT